MGAKNEKVSYWRGKEATTPQDIISGRLLFQQDTGNVFFDYRDYSNGEPKRIQLTDTTKMSKFGGKFEGDVILFADPTDPLGAVTKQYADKIDNKIQKHIDNTTIHITANERKSWNNKVDKEAGKGLSTNDFTTAQKNKLDGISENANKTAVNLNYTPTASQLSNFYDLGTISIDNTTYHIYAPIQQDVKGNAYSANKLKTKRYIDGVGFDGTQSINHFANCQTAGATQNKEITIDDFKFEQGSILNVYFRYNNTNDNPNLVVNGNERPIYYHGTTLNDASKLDIGLYTFVYIGGSNSRFEMVSSVDTQYGEATENQPGLLSPEDKAKLDSIEENANHYELPVATDSTLGGVKIGDYIQSDSSGKIYLTYDGIVSALGFTPLTQASLDKELIRQMLEPFKGASISENGSGGLVPTPYIGMQDSFLKGDGTWGSTTVDSISTTTVKLITDNIIYTETFDDPNSTPYAVYSSDDNSLTFYQRSYIPEEGEIFRGKTASIVYICGEYGFRTISDPTINLETAWMWSGKDFEYVYCIDSIYFDQNHNIATCDGMFGNSRDTVSKLRVVDLSKAHFNVASCREMFVNRTNLESVKFGQFNNTEPISLQSCFNRSITDSRDFALTSVEFPYICLCNDLYAAFVGPNNLHELDLSNVLYGSNRIVNLGYTFTQCRTLETIYVDNDFSLSSSNSTWANTFDNCLKLSGKSEGGISYSNNPTFTTTRYAKCDGGYFTYIKDKVNE